jgi:hypothetical protein
MSFTQSGRCLPSRPVTCPQARKAYTTGYQISAGGPAKRFAAYVSAGLRCSRASGQCH